MNTFQHWLAQYMTPPPHLSRAEQRAFATAMVTFPVGVIVHTLFIGMFMWLGSPMLAVLNIGSVAVWALGLWLVRANDFKRGFLMISVEVIVHAIIAVQQLGLDFGFQYYVLTMLAGAFVGPIDRRIQWGVAILSGVVFIVLVFHPEVVWLGDPLIPAVFTIVNLTSVSGLMALMASYSQMVAYRAEKALEAEHAKSEGLLHNILPDEIAERLKQGDGTIADGFADTSVLFADIADFTPMSQRLTPAEVVQLLDDLFSRFDVLVRKHKLEKIKTIGDAYMVAAGVPIPRADHAQVMALLAQDIRQAMRDYNAEKGTNIRLRIGINSGPVVAGVIGKMRFLYDLWGDCVNTASRMESHGVPDEIQISEHTRALLEGKYHFEDRGLIDIKGKGPMRTYFLRDALGQPLMESA